MTLDPIRGRLLALPHDAFEALLVRLGARIDIPGPAVAQRHRVEELLDLLARTGMRGSLAEALTGDPEPATSDPWVLATGPWREHKNPVQLMMHPRQYVLAASVASSSAQLLRIEQQQAYDGGYEIYNGDVASLFDYHVRAGRLTLHLRRAKFFDFLVSHPSQDMLAALQQQDPGNDLHRVLQPSTRPFCRSRANPLTFILNVVTDDNKAVVGLRSGNMREYAWRWDAVVGTTVTPQMIVASENPYDVARSLLASDFVLDDSTLHGARIRFDSLSINRDNNEPDLLGTARLPLPARELIARARMAGVTGLEPIELVPRRVDSFIAATRSGFAPNSMACVVQSIRSIITNPQDEDLS